MSHKSTVSKTATRSAALLLAVCLGGCLTARADEIRLKDGNKLYGVIVGYEDNMFKVKTPFGYVLVEKDKIADIVPSTIGAPDAKAGAKKDALAASKKSAAAKAARDATAHDGNAADPANATGSDGSPTSATTPPAAGRPSATDVSEKSVDSATAKREKTAAILANSAVKPQLPAPTQKKVVAPALRSSSPAPDANGKVVISAAVPALPKMPDVAPEEIRGNLYINHANTFSIYKAPSWNLIEDARKALPNAVVAMGTYNESTLLVVGKEKDKQALQPAAEGVERRVREVYENYRLISHRTTTIDGLPGIEYRFRGVADDHDWSGTLVVLTRGGETFTVLGMTFADTDLIQIQENVISRAIASLKFSGVN